VGSSVAKLLQFTERWTPDRNMRDQYGKVAVVSGGTSGLGYEIAKQLVQHHGHVIVADRNKVEGYKCAAPHWWLTLPDRSVWGIGGMPLLLPCCCSTSQHRQRALFSAEHGLTLA
jgi:NAD(P)-dependent dehydrogenase (short-subunit alcohol dehydrogenase family)